MKVLVASSSEIALPLVRALAESEHNLLGLISTPNAPAGRGRVAAPNPFVAAGLDYPLFQPNTHVELSAVLHDLAPDLVVTAAYGRLIKREELALPKYGWLNIHYSLLPKWRGAAPVQRSLLAGESLGGYTIFSLDEGMDTGPIYFQREVAYPAEAGTRDLLNLFSSLAAKDLLPVLADISAGVQPTPQIETENRTASHAAKIDKYEGAITVQHDWQSARAIYLALRDNPGVYLDLSLGRLKVRAADFIAEQLIDCGRISFLDGCLVVGLKVGVLRISRLVAPGKKEMSASEFCRGYRGEFAWA